MTIYQTYKQSLVYKLVHLIVLASFIAGLIVPPQKAYGQAVLPVPGTMVPPSVVFNEPILKGLKVYPDNPLKFDFIVDSGEERLKDEALKEESTKLIKYFLAALTTPEEEMWVNLSPHEKDKIIPNEFGTTEMGRDLLAQDYLLKQLTASLIYPEKELGKEFWGKVYKKAQELYGITDIPVNTFNKVWIVPSKAVVYEKNGTVFVVNSRLKVMMEEDYVALRANQTQDTGHTTQGENGKSAGEIRDTRYKIRDARYDIQDTKYDLAVSEQRKVDRESLPVSQLPVGQKNNAQTGELANQILKEIILPEIEREVNEGKNFAQLRQIFNSFILAMWYKRNLKESLLGKVYVDKNRVKGIAISDKDEKEKIYQRYLEAYKKGVYNYIKEEYDTRTQQMIPRKYFSGGVRFQLTSLGVAELQEVHELGELSQGDRAVLAEDMANGPERLTSHTVVLAEDQQAGNFVQAAQHAAAIIAAGEVEDPAMTVERLAAQLKASRVITLKVGDDLKHYQVLEVIWDTYRTGVYLVEDIQGNLYIIKQFKSWSEDGKMDNIHRLAKEINVYQRVAESPGRETMRLPYAIEQWDNFIVFPYKPGQSMTEFLKSGVQLADREWIILGLETALQIAQALDNLHVQFGLVHRDVKLDNILFDPETGYASLMDLGLANPIGQWDPFTPKESVGPRDFMAPEQMDLQRPPNAMTDLYSLAICLYWMITGEHPFAEQVEEDSSPSSSGIDEIVLRYGRMKNPDYKPRYLRENETLIPENLKIILLRMLEFQQEKRYSSAKIVMKELSKTLAEIKGQNQEAVNGLTEDPSTAVGLEDPEFFALAIDKLKSGEDMPPIPSGGKVIYTQTKVYVNADIKMESGYSAFLQFKGRSRKNPHSIPIPFNVLEEFNIKKNDMVIAVLTEEINHPGYFLYIYKPEDFNFENPLEARNPLPVVYGLVGGLTAQGEDVGRKFLPVDLAKMDILAFAAGRKDLVSAGRRYETNVIKTKVKGEAAFADLVISVNNKLWRRTTFGLSSDDVEKYALLERKDRPVILELKVDPDYGPYVEVSVKMPHGNQFLRTNLWIEDSKTKNKNVPVDLNRLALIDYVQDQMNVHGHKILPRRYLHSNAVSEIGTLLIEAELEIDRGIDVDPLPLLAGKQPIFIPKQDRVHGQVIEVHDHEGYQKNPERKPEYMLQRDISKNKLKNIEKGAEDQDKKSLIVSLQNEVEDLSQQFIITRAAIHKIVSQERPENLLIHVAEIVANLEEALELLRKQINPAITRNLNAALRRRQLSIAEFLQTPDVEPNQVYHLTTGNPKFLVSRENHAKLAAALGIAMEDLAPQRNSNLNLDQEYQLERSLLSARYLFGHLLWLTSKAYGFPASDLAKYLRVTKESLNSPMRGIGDPLSVDRINLIARIIGKFVNNYSLKTVYTSISWHRQNQLNHNINTRIGQEIRKWRKLKGIDQKALAAAAVIHPASLSKIEHGGSASRSRETQERFARAFGITYAEFLAPVQADIDEENRLEKRFLLQQEAARQNLVRLLKERGIEPEDIESTSKQFQEIAERIGLSGAVLRTMCRAKNQIFPEHLLVLANGLGVDVSVLWDPEDLVEVRFGIDALKEGEIELLLWGQASRYSDPVKYEAFLLNTGLLSRFVKKISLGRGLSFNAYRKSIPKLAVLMQAKGIHRPGEPLMMADLACGPYTLWAAWHELEAEEDNPALEEILADAVVTAVDVSSGMLEAGEQIRNELFPEFSINPIHGSMVDLKTLGVSDESFDVTTLGFGLQQMRTSKEKIRALLEAHRVTKRGGLIVLVGPPGQFRSESWQSSDLGKVLVVPKSGDRADLLILQKTENSVREEVLEEIFSAGSRPQQPSREKVQEGEGLTVSEEFTKDDPYRQMAELGQFVEETAREIVSAPAADSEVYALRNIRHLIAIISRLSQQRASLSGRNEREEKRIAELEVSLIKRLKKLNLRLKKSVEHMSLRELRGLRDAVNNLGERRWFRQYLEKHPQIASETWPRILQIINFTGDALLKSERDTEDPAMTTDILESKMWKILKNQGPLPKIEFPKSERVREAFRRFIDGKDFTDNDVVLVVEQAVREMQVWLARERQREFSTLFVERKIGSKHDDELRRLWLQEPRNSFSDSRLYLTGEVCSGACSRVAHNIIPRLLSLTKGRIDIYKISDFADFTAKFWHFVVVVRNPISGKTYLIDPTLRQFLIESEEPEKIIIRESFLGLSPQFINPLLTYGYVELNDDFLTAYANIFRQINDLGPKTFTINNLLASLYKMSIEPRGEAYSQFFKTSYLDEFEIYPDERRLVLDPTVFEEIIREKPGLVLEEIFPDESKESDREDPAMTVEEEFAGRLREIEQAAEAKVLIKKLMDEVWGLIEGGDDLWMGDNPQAVRAMRKVFEYMGEVLGQTDVSNQNKADLMKAELQDILKKVFRGRQIIRLYALHRELWRYAPETGLEIMNALLMHIYDSLSLDGQDKGLNDAHWNHLFVDLLYLERQMELAEESLKTVWRQDSMGDWLETLSTKPRFQIPIGAFVFRLILLNPEYVKKSLNHEAILKTMFVFIGKLENRKFLRKYGIKAKAVPFLVMNALAFSSTLPGFERYGLDPEYKNLMAQYRGRKMLVNTFSETWERFRSANSYRVLAEAREKMEGAVTDSKHWTALASVIGSFERKEFQTEEIPEEGDLFLFKDTWGNIFPMVTIDKEVRYASQDQPILSISLMGLDSVSEGHMDLRPGKKPQVWINFEPFLVVDKIFRLISPEKISEDPIMATTDYESPVGTDRRDFLVSQFKELAKLDKVIRSSDNLWLGDNSEAIQTIRTSLDYMRYGRKAVIFKKKLLVKLRDIFYGRDLPRLYVLHREIWSILPEFGLEAMNDLLFHIYQNLAVSRDSRVGNRQFNHLLVDIFYLQRQIEIAEEALGKAQSGKTLADWMDENLKNGLLQEPIAAFVLRLILLDPEYVEKKLNRKVIIQNLLTYLQIMSDKKQLNKKIVLDRNVPFVVMNTLQFIRDLPGFKNSDLRDLHERVFFQYQQEGPVKNDFQVEKLALEKTSGYKLLINVHGNLSGNVVDFDHKFNEMINQLTASWQRVELDSDVHISVGTVLLIQREEGLEIPMLVTDISQGPEGDEVFLIGLDSVREGMLRMDNNQGVLAIRLMYPDVLVGNARVICLIPPQEYKDQYGQEVEDPAMTVDWAWKKLSDDVMIVDRYLLVFMNMLLRVVGSPQLQYVLQNSRGRNRVPDKEKELIRSFQIQMKGGIEAEHLSPQGLSKRDISSIVTHHFYNLSRFLLANLPREESLEFQKHLRIWTNKDTVSRFELVAEFFNTPGVWIPHDGKVRIETLRHERVHWAYTKIKEEERELLKAGYMEFLQSLEGRRVLGKLYGTSVIYFHKLYFDLRLMRFLQDQLKDRVRFWEEFWAQIAYPSEGYEEEFLIKKRQIIERLRSESEVFRRAYEFNEKLVEEVSDPKAEEDWQLIKARYPRLIREEVAEDPAMTVFKFAFHLLRIDHASHAEPYIEALVTEIGNLIKGDDSLWQGDNPQAIRAIKKVFEYVSAPKKKSEAGISSQAQSAKEQKAAFFKKRFKALLTDPFFDHQLPRLYMVHREVWQYMPETGLEIINALLMHIYQNLYLERKTRRHGDFYLKHLLVDILYLEQQILIAEASLKENWGWESLGDWLESLARDIKFQLPIGAFIFRLLLLNPEYVREYLNRESIIENVLVFMERLGDRDFAERFGLKQEEISSLVMYALRSLGDFPDFTDDKLNKKRDELFSRFSNNEILRNDILKDLESFRRSDGYQALVKVRKNLIGAVTKPAYEKVLQDFIKHCEHVELKEKEIPEAGALILFQGKDGTSFPAVMTDNTAGPNSLQRVIGLDGVAEGNLRLIGDKFVVLLTYTSLELEIDKVVRLIPPKEEQPNEMSVNRAEDPAMMLAADDRVGDYKVVSVLGKGPWGEVYLVRDTRLPLDHPTNSFVMKIFYKALMEKPEPRAYILREIEFCKRIREKGDLMAQNYLPYSIDQNEDYPYLVFPYRPGESLKDYFRKNRIVDPEERLKIALLVGIDVGQALYQLHSKFALVHRDVKPGNILFDPNLLNMSWLIDLGIATEIDRPDPVNPKEKVGTPKWMVPELLNLDDFPTAATDIHSLGQVIYWIITDEMPFDEDVRPNDPKIDYIRERNSLDSHYIPSQLRDGPTKVPNELKSVLIKMLRPKAQERYQSAIEVVKDLAQYRNKLEGIPKGDESSSNIPFLEELPRVTQQGRLDSENLGVEVLTPALKRYLEKILQSMPEEEKALIRLVTQDDSAYFVTNKTPTALEAENRIARGLSVVGSIFLTANRGLYVDTVRIKGAGGAEEGLPIIPFKSHISTRVLNYGADMDSLLLEMRNALSLAYLSSFVRQQFDLPGVYLPFSVRPITKLPYYKDHLSPEEYFLRLAEDEKHGTELRQILQMSEKDWQNHKLRKEGVLKFLNDFQPGQMFDINSERYRLELVSELFKYPRMFIQYLRGHLEDRQNPEKLKNFIIDLVDSIYEKAIIGYRSSRSDFTSQKLDAWEILQEYRQKTVLVNRAAIEYSFRHALQDLGETLGVLWSVGGDLGQQRDSALHPKDLALRKGQFIIHDLDVANIPNQQNAEFDQQRFLNAFAEPSNNLLDAEKCILLSLDTYLPIPEPGSLSQPRQRYKEEYQRILHEAIVKGMRTAFRRIFLNPQQKVFTVKYIDSFLRGINSFQFRNSISKIIVMPEIVSSLIKEMQHLAQLTLDDPKAARRYLEEVAPRLEEDPAMMLAADDRVGDYKVVSVLGKGPWGEVYLVRDTRLPLDHPDNSFVMKVSPRQSDPNYQARVDREAKIYERIRNDGDEKAKNYLPYAVDRGQERWFSYVIFPYREGTSLKEYFLNHSDISPETRYEIAMHVGIDMAQGLHQLHSKFKLVHRDVKPSNILFSRNANMSWLLDLGIAAELGVADPLDEDRIVGTLPWLAPEQIDGNTPANATTDLYSLALVIYWILTGEIAFNEEDDGSTDEILQTRLQRMRNPDYKPRHLRDDSDQIPPGLKRILNKMLQFDPLFRYQSGAQVAAVLSRYFEAYPTPGMDIPLENVLGKLENQSLNQAEMTNDPLELEFTIPSESHSPIDLVIPKEEVSELEDLPLYERTQEDATRRVGKSDGPDIVQDSEDPALLAGATVEAHPANTLESQILETIAPERRAEILFKLSQIVRLLGQTLGKKYRYDPLCGPRHSEEMLAKAIRLAERLRLLDKIDWEVVTAAIALHDVRGEKPSEEIVKSVLAQATSFDQAQMEKVQEIITLHYETGDKAKARRTKAGLEAQVVYDADQWESFGIKGVYREILRYIRAGYSFSKIKEEGWRNIQACFRNVHFSETHSLAWEEFAVARAFFNKLRSESYSEKDMLGATGVVNLIMQNAVESPTFVSHSAFAQIRGRKVNIEQKEDDAFMRDFFLKLFNVYEDSVLMELLWDFREVGPQKAVAYHNLEDLQGTENLWMEEAQALDLGAYLSNHETDRLYLYDRNVLQGILDRNQKALKKSGIPIDPDQFIVYLSFHSVPANSPAYDVIRQAFADNREALEEDGELPLFELSAQDKSFLELDPLIDLTRIHDKNYFSRDRGSVESLSELIEVEDSAMMSDREELHEWFAKNNLLDPNIPLTEQDIKNLHIYVEYEYGVVGDAVHDSRSQTEIREFGVYRNRNYPDLRVLDHDKIKLAMEVFIQWLAIAEKRMTAENAEEWIAEAFIRFITIHPFQDANGRAARLLVNLLLARHGRPMIDLSLIKWKPEYYTGYLSLMPADALYLASLIRDAQKGISTVAYQRYGIKEEAEVMEMIRGIIMGQKQWVDIDQFTENQALNWLRSYVGAAPPELDIIRNVYEKSKMSDFGKREWMALIYVVQERSGRPEDQQRFNQVVRYFERIIPGAAEVRKQIDQNTESLFKLDDSLLSQKGGIDFDPKKGFELEIQRDGEGVPLPSNLHNVENIHIDGFVPILINVTPIHNLPLVLGMTEEEDLEQLAQLSASK